MEQCELEKQNKINFKNVCLIWRENTWLESTLDNQELIVVYLCIIFVSMQFEKNEG